MHDALSTAAAAGDMDVLGEWLATQWESLRLAAIRTAGVVMDPDDLLAEAVTALLTQWRQGTGPRSGLFGYLVRSMRNRIIDEVRSPRSRVVSLDLIPDRAAHEDRSAHLSELHRERRWVRQALALLPHDQRRVLISSVVHGRRPGELATELARPANAVSSLTRRARLGLRRNLLQVMLETDAGESCRGHARALPATIPDEITTESASPALAHIVGCHPCHQAWQAFRATGSALHT